MLKKDYFPTAKAPEIARKKIMQYVYGSKKNLTKRFNFYRIYAPAFVVLILFFVGANFYNREFKKGDDVYNILENGVDNTPSIEKKSTEEISIERDNNLEGEGDEIIQEEYRAQEDMIKENMIQEDVVEEKHSETLRTLSIVNPGNAEIAQDSNYPSSARLDSQSSMENNLAEKQVKSFAMIADDIDLEKQINEIENLLNDISSITSQEENNF